MSTEGWKGRSATPPGPMGPLVGEFAALKQRVTALETAAPLRSAAISAGGLTIKDGGNVTILDGGDVLINGGDLRLVSDEGSFQALHPDGSPAAAFGPLWLDASPGVTESRGLLVQAPIADSNSDILRAKYVLADGTTWVYIGQSGASGNVDGFGAWADAVSINGGSTTYVRATTGFAQFEGFTGATVYSPQQVQLNSDINQVFITHTTSTDAANCVITTAGQIKRSTSSLRYKVDVEDLDLVPAQVLGMRPVTFRSRDEAEADPTTTKRYPGFIAEEIAELGLEEFVIRDEQGRPDALRYDRIAAAQQIVIRDHAHRTATLEATVTAQADLIAALAARLDRLEAS